MNKNRNNINKKYNDILVRLKKYAFEKGAQKELGVESYSCVPFNS
jgi:hypothetical protein